jgi:ankyrin repeat protein
MLLKYKAEVDAKTNDGQTVMHGTAANGYEAVVRQLLENKTDVDAKTDDGWTVLQEAVTNGHQSC